MVTIGVEVMRHETAMEEVCNVKGLVAKQGEGLKQYHFQKIHELLRQLRQLRQKTNNLNRLEAQRNEFNS